MQVFFGALNNILSIVFLISTGWALARLKWFSEESSQLVAKLVTGVALPCLMIYNISNTFTKEQLIELSAGMFLPIVAASICIVIGAVVVKLAKIRVGRRGLLHSTFYVSNTIFIGLPINLALFGESSVPYVLIYYIVNTVAFWVIAINIIATEKETGKQWREFLSVATLQKIFSPPLLGFLVAVLIVLLKIPLPEAVLQTCKHLGNMTTPLSMLFIGIAISRIKLTWAYFDKDIFLALGARFLLAPIVVISLQHIWPVANMLMFKVFVIQAAMPVMTQSAIIAKYYDVDAEYAAMLTTVSTLLAMLVIPFYMWVFAAIMYI